MLSDEQIEKFRTLYKNHFNEELSKEEARQQGTKLVSLMKVIYNKLLPK